MPVWTGKPADDLAETMAEVMKDLEVEVADNPTFTEVAGIPLGALVSQASEALVPILAASGEDPTHVNRYVQAYCLGFVVGKKFGERNHITPKEENDE